MAKKNYDTAALFRYAVISPLLHERIIRGELRKKMKKLSEKYFELPNGEIRKYAYKTIEEWYYLYKQYGLSGLEKRPRSDQGQSRTIPPELGELIIKMKIENPQRSVNQILKELLLAGKIHRGEIGRSSVYRLLHYHKEAIKQQLQGDNQKELKRYAFAFANECWQSDVKHGPHLKLEGHPGKKKVYLFALLDDASRIIPHGEFVLRENLENFLSVLKIAIMKKGIPYKLYIDNASYFRSPLVQKIGARIGMKVIYTKPYSAYQKGKIERFWRRCSDQFLSHLDRKKIYTLDYLNRMFNVWIEKDYHHTIHSSLGCTPIEAWQKKSGDIRYPDAETMKKDFLYDQPRKIRKDGTFMLKGKYYDYDSTEHGKSFLIRYDPGDLQKVYVYDGKQFIQEVYPVNEVENQKTARKKVASTKKIEPSGISYIDLLEKEDDDNV